MAILAWDLVAIRPHSVIIPLITKRRFRMAFVGVMDSVTSPTSNYARLLRSGHIEARRVIVLKVVCCGGLHDSCFLWSWTAHPYFELCKVAPLTHVGGWCVGHNYVLYVDLVSSWIISHVLLCKGRQASDK